MKTIIVNEANMKKIEDEIENVQAKAKTRTIDASDINRAIATIEKTLGISKKDMEGLAVEVDMNAQDFPNAYRYRAESTIFRIRREGGKWRVTNICRGYTKRAGHQYEIYSMPETTKAAIIKTKMVF